MGSLSERGLTSLYDNGNVNRERGNLVEGKLERGKFVKEICRMRRKSMERG